MQCHYLYLYLWWHVSVSVFKRPGDVLFFVLLQSSNLSSFVPTVASVSRSRLKRVEQDVIFAHPPQALTCFVFWDAHHGGYLSYNSLAILLWPFSSTMCFHLQNWCSLEVFWFSHHTQETILHGKTLLEPAVWLPLPMVKVAKITLFSILMFDVNINWSSCHVSAWFYACHVIGWLGNCMHDQVYRYPQWSGRWKYLLKNKHFYLTIYLILWDLPQMRSAPAILVQSNS